MKKIIFALILLAVSIGTQAAITPVTVADSSVSTVSGVGGYADVVYKFAKGDKVTLVASASKELERVMVVILPQNVLMRVKNIKKVSQTFEVPESGNVVIRFVSDRGGVNNIKYNIVRLPASEDLQSFNTNADTINTTVKLHP
jgi:hypothetical protein